jgi:gas vesicle protein
MSDSNDFGNFFAGFIMGGLVGAAVALLLAPQSGEETRAIIKDKSIELKDKAVEYSQEAKVRAEQAMLDARTRAGAAIDDLRARTDEYARATKERISGIQPAGPVVLEEQKLQLKPKSMKPKPAICVSCSWQGYQLGNVFGQTIKILSIMISH